jgi:hypothetical protein
MALAAISAVQTEPVQAARPSLAGVWNVVEIKPPVKDSETALKPGPITIRQTPTTLAVDHTAFGRVNTLTFTIGGTKPDTNRQGAQTWSTSTRWEDAALVTTGTISQVTSAGYDEWKYTERRSLDARGHMIVEMKYVGQDGRVTASTLDLARQRPPGEV